MNVESFTPKNLFENIDFKSSLLKTLKLLDPTECQSMILLILLLIHEIPIVLPICFTSCFLVLLVSLLTLNVNIL